MKKHVITRRQFIRVSSMTVLGSALVACGAPAAPAEEAAEAPAETETTSELPPATSGQYTESPTSAELVSAGELPPVDERLPANPLVWTDYDVVAMEKEQGQYGGTVRIGNAGGINGLATFGLARYTADDTRTFVADMAESWEVSDDATSFTFHLREGHKWSDGTPLTAHDMQWYYDNVIHSEYLDSPMGWAGMETTTDRIVAVDDFTVRFEFAKPNSLFLELSRGVAGGEAGLWSQSAPHYVQKYHPDYNRMDEYDDPKEQFQKEVQDRLPFQMTIQDPERPVLWGWKPFEYAEGQIARLDRNHYFHCVDRWGQQMPYVEVMENLLLGSRDKDVILLKLVAGETHWERRLGSVTDVPFLNEQAGDTLDFIYTIKPEGAQQGIYFSAHADDENMDALLKQADFRRALSIAIDRATINETAYFGLGKIGHGFSLPGVFDPEIDGKWVEYNPEAASQMLDDLGITERDDEGFRTYENGETMTFILGSAPGWHPGAQESAEIAAEGWNAIGLRTVVTVASPGDMIAEWREGISHAYVRSSIGGDVMFDLKHSTGLRWGAPSYRWWVTRDLPADEVQGVEPPDDLKYFLELGDKILSVISEEEREELIHERRVWMADTCWFIGMVQTVPHVLVANKKLRGIWGREEEIPWKLGAGDEEFWPRSWFWTE